MKGQPRRSVRTSRHAQSQSLALLVVDNGPLQKAAWQKLQAARKRLIKATADLHRHEQQDEPAYRSWMFASCPAVLSEIRELAIQCDAKRLLIANVESLAWRQGKPPAVIWQMYKGQIPSAPINFRDEEDDEDEDWPTEGDEDEDRDQSIDDLLREQGIDPLSPEAELIRDLGRQLTRHEDPEPEDEAKEIYRRLVQQLHPDRGGEWTERREALWHEVQRAWDVRDADWLARLEAELEIVTETLSVASAVGRLGAALKEIDAARRDTERKLREYRKTPAWRFTLKPRDPSEEEELASTLRDQRDMLRANLAALEATFARWEKPLGLARSKQRRGEKRSLEPSQLNLW